MYMEVRGQLSELGLTFHHVSTGSQVCLQVPLPPYRWAISPIIIIRTIRSLGWQLQNSAPQPLSLAQFPGWEDNGGDYQVRGCCQYPGAKGGGGRYSSGSQSWASGKSTGSDLVAWTDRALTSFSRQALTPETASLQLAGLEAVKVASPPLQAWGSEGFWKEVAASAPAPAEWRALSQLVARVVGL